MFEGLDEIAWNEVGGVSPADDVPQTIRDLTSGDPQVWEHAMDELVEIICHQGTITEATSYTIPFLTEVLASDAVLCKPDILLTLYTICWVHQDKEFVSPRAVAQYSVFVDRTLAAIQDGGEVYTDLLEDPDRGVRATAAFTLPLLICNGSRSAPALLSRLKVETDQEAKAVLAWSLGEAVTGEFAASIAIRVKAVPLLRSLIASGEANRVRYAAARSLLKAEGARVASEAIEVLLDGLARPAEYNSPESHLYVSARDISEEFCRLDTKRRLAAFRGALEIVPESRDAHEIAMTMMDRLVLGAPKRVNPKVYDFSDPEMVRYGDYGTEIIDIKSLSPEQRKAIQIFVEADKIWERPSNLAEIYGLPPSRDEARELIKQA